MGKMLKRLKSIRVPRVLFRATRYVLHRRGDGVHSPLAFDVIRQVYRNPYPFLAFEELGAAFDAARRRKNYRSLIHQRKVAETIFRFVHRFGRGEIVLLSEPDTLLAPYLLATGKGIIRFESIFEVQSLPEITIIESIQFDEVASLKELLAQPRVLSEEVKMVILSKEHPLVREHLSHLRGAAQPVVIFDTLELEVWLWRSSLTEGRYKVFS